MAQSKFVFAAILASIAGASSPGLAENNTPAKQNADIITKLTIEDVQGALQDSGYRAQIKEDSNGSYVSSSSGGQNFFVSLGGCDDQKLCKSMLMETGGWTPKTPPTVEALNKFHYDNGGWGAAMTYNDGKYYTDYRVSLVGGITKVWLQSTLETFAVTTENFAALMQK